MRKRKKNKVIDATNNPLAKPENSFGYRNKLKPRSINQQEFIKTIVDSTITFCQGVAGSGKTHIAVGMALDYLFTNKVKKIIITRPVVESGEKIGYLPGTAEDKLHPYLLPILDEINYFISVSEYVTLKNHDKIEIVPLGLMRGRNFHHAFIVADECQNASYDQLKMLLTRIGHDSKMILTGDCSQSDLHKSMRGGFGTLINVLQSIPDIGVSTLDNTDIVRNPIIGKILDQIDIYEHGSGQP